MYKFITPTDTLVCSRKKAFQLARICRARGIWFCILKGKHKRQIAEWTE